MNTLIVYAGKYGFTEKCAGMLKSELQAPTDLVNLRKVKSVDLSRYDCVIIGGSVYIGRIRKEVTEFCAKNMNQLAGKKIGLFICGMADGEDADKELHTNFPPELQKIAAAMEDFGGEFNFDRMNFFDRTIVKKIVKATSNRSNMQDHKIHAFAEAMNRA